MFMTEMKPSEREKTVIGVGFLDFPKSYNMLAYIANNGGKLKKTDIVKGLKLPNKKFEMYANSLLKSQLIKIPENIKEKDSLEVDDYGYYVLDLAERFSDNSRRKP